MILNSKLKNLFNWFGLASKNERHWPLHLHFSLLSEGIFIESDVSMELTIAFFQCLHELMLGPLGKISHRKAQPDQTESATLNKLHKVKVIRSTHVHCDKAAP